MDTERPEGIEKYDGPAAGWGATKALAQTLARQRVVVQGVRTLLRANQPDGFDCPGCAWPDPRHTSSFEFCENGAKAVTWESTAKRVGPEFFAAHSVASLWTKSDHWLEGQGRITHPLRYNRETDHFEPVDWQEAFDDIAGVLNALEPDSVEFYTSGRASNEAAFLFQLFARSLGTNNFPDCSNMCHEPTSVGLPRSIGVGKGTVTLEDFDHADLILSLGHNPGTNHPRMLTSLREASRRGAAIIVFNPIKERALERFEAPQSPIEMVTLTSTNIATQYLQVRIGGDVAALKGVCKALLELDAQARSAGEAPLLDDEFIATHTTGYDDFAADIRQTSWESIERCSGLLRDDLVEVARVYGAARSTIACWGMGITQHVTGTQNVQQVVNLLLLKGNIGRPGAGVCPLRGHSNVQGNRTVGITERPSEAFLDRLRDVFAFDPPRKHGHSVVESIAAMRAGSSRAMISLGGNLAVATSDPGAAFEAFRALDLSVCIGTKLNRTHLLTGKKSYVLPCLGRTELDMQETGRQSVTVEDSMSMVHASSGFLAPPSDHVRSEPWIVASLAKATLGDRSSVDWRALAADYSLIRDQIEAVFPDFAGFNKRIQTPGGFQLPNAAQRRVWNTESRKANFSVFAGLEEDMLAPGGDVLKLMTMRSHDQYNTTIYGLDDRYRGVFGRRDILFISESDLNRLDLREGDLVDVATALDHEKADRIVRGLTLVRYDIPPGCCGGYYPETQALVALEHVDPDSLTPSFKSVPVRIKTSAGGSSGPVAIERAGVAGRGVAAA